ncbi:hypothetical protein [Haloarcula marina]|nr:hypothetical protein [Halomicroarcula marina]
MPESRALAVAVALLLVTAGCQDLTTGGADTPETAAVGESG